MLFSSSYKYTMQVSPSGMAAASQAVPGEFDSRHLLQISIIRTIYKSRVNGSDLLFISIHRKIRDIMKQIEKSSVFRLNSFSI